MPESETSPSVPIESCIHDELSANLEVISTTGIGRFRLDVQVRCAACHLPFQFMGALPDVVSADGTQLSVHIEPKAAKTLFERFPIHMPKLPEKV